MVSSCQSSELSWSRVVRVASCHGVELSEWRVVMVSSCQSGELSWCRVVRLASCPGDKLSE
jgi:alkylated DNA nucleotide flippase Atl1